MKQTPCHVASRGARRSGPQLGSSIRRRRTEVPLRPCRDGHGQGTTAGLREPRSCAQRAQGCSEPRNSGRSPHQRPRTRRRPHATVWPLGDRRRTRNGEGASLVPDDDGALQVASRLGHGVALERSARTAGVSGVTGSWAVSGDAPLTTSAVRAIVQQAVRGGRRRGSLRTQPPGRQRAVPHRARRAHRGRRDCRPLEGPGMLSATPRHRRPAGGRCGVLRRRGSRSGTGLPALRAGHVVAVGVAAWDSVATVGVSPGPAAVLLAVHVRAFLHCPVGPSPSPAAILLAFHVEAFIHAALKPLSGGEPQGQWPFLLPSTYGPSSTWPSASRQVQWPFALPSRSSPVPEEDVGLPSSPV